MEQSQKVIHRRLVSGTTVFHNELINLGFIQTHTEGSGLKKVTTFAKNIDGEDKFVESSYNRLKLIRLYESKEVIEYSGLTVHDELLRFFSNRAVTNNKANGLSEEKPQEKSTSKG